MEYNKETKILTIDYRFDEELKDIPEETKAIIFYIYSKFNKKVDKIPQSLTHLTFGYNFNQKVDNLPQSLTHLTLSHDFNQKVDNLPKNLTYLTFGSYFNQKVNNLPQSLTHLTFGNRFNQKVDNLPKNLKYLNLGWDFQNKIIIPINLNKLSLKSTNNLINIMPEHIEKLYIKFFNNKKFNKKVENLPPTLKEIIIEDEKFKEYIKIPFGCILTIKKIE